MPVGQDESRTRGSAGADDVQGEALDVGLLEATLAMTVRERLQLNDRTIRMLAKLRAGFAGLRDSANDRSR
jgi:hypothetical protein